MVWPTSSPGLRDPSLCLTRHKKDSSCVTHCGWFAFSFCKTALFGETWNVDGQFIWLTFPNIIRVFFSFLHLIKEWTRKRGSLRIKYKNFDYFFLQFTFLACSNPKVQGCIFLITVTMSCCTSALGFSILHHFTSAIRPPGSIDPLIILWRDNYTICKLPNGRIDTCVTCRLP